MKLTHMTRSLAIGLVASTLLIVGGCSRAKDEATQAVSAAEASLQSVSADAAKFVPKELESVEASVTSLKQSLAQKDYKTVVANAPTVNSGIESLKSSVAAKVDEAKAASAEWGNYSTAVPQMVSALQSRVDMLAKSKRMPKGLDAKSFATVQTDLDNMKAEWMTAVSSNNSGDPIDAVTKAKSAQATGQRLLQQLGMPTG